MPESMYSLIAGDKPRPTLVYGPDPGWTTPVDTPWVYEGPERSEWENICAPGSSTRLNVGNMFSHATLDIICDICDGTAALGLPVNSVQNPQHPLAFSHLNVLASALRWSKGRLIFHFLKAYIPNFLLRLALLGPLSPVRRFSEVTSELIVEKQRAFERDVGGKPDLLSAILAGRGASKSAVTPSQILLQIPLLLVAGQDTTLSFQGCRLVLRVLLARSEPEFQQSLGQEIFNLQALEGGLEYDNLSLLNALLKRYASKDSILPVSSEIITSTGKAIRELPIRKGQIIFLASAAYQRYPPPVFPLEAMWGPDANEFKPSRWLAGDPCIGQVNAVGPYSCLSVPIFSLHRSVFLGGHYACGGWRFALLDMQVIITELLAKFSFSLPENSAVRAVLAGTLSMAMGQGSMALCRTLANWDEQGGRHVLGEWQTGNDFLAVVDN
ncbi:cytochrome P450 [Mycena latifolia]|nr:cytochrome P450 [Mycena latifolia]